MPTQRTVAVALQVLALVLGGAATFVVPAHLAVADTVAASDMLLLTNQYRFAVGAPTIPSDPRVVTAAQNHANYNSANNVLGHYETAGLPYYTGYGPRERVAAAGLSAAFVSEVATSFAGGLAGVRQLWDAPYHRLGMMHPNATTIGWGHSDLTATPATVGDIVYDFGIHPVDFVRSPANGQTGIPTSWNGHESPNPLPSGATSPVGYPIMVVYSSGQTVDMRAAEVDAPDGTRLPIYYAPQQFERDYQVIVPQSPLAAGTTYHVRFDINVNGVMTTNQWDFTTAGASAFSPTLTYHSAFVDESPFPTLQPGATTQLTMRFRNTGTATWQKGVAGSQANLGINGDDVAFSALGMNVNWIAPNRPAAQSESSVVPGAVATFTFTVRAPSTPGVYRIPLRPVIDGTTWMEDQGAFLLVTSDTGYHSHWAGQSPYPTLAPGATSGMLSVRFTNTGTRTWVNGVLGQQANLGVVGDVTTWSALGVRWLSANRVAAQTEASVAPGAVGTFTFQLIAPSVPGIYRFAVRPVIDGTTWMEDDGVFLVVTVSN